MHVGNQMVSGTTLQTNMADTGTVIVEVKYINQRMLLFILKTAKQLVTTGVRPDIIESLDNEVREEQNTEQPETIDTYSESDSDTDSGDENEHADQTVISIMQHTRLGRTRRLTQRMSKESPKLDWYIIQVRTTKICTEMRQMMTST